MKDRFAQVLREIREIAWGGKLYAKDVDSLMERLDWIIQACKEWGRSDEEAEDLQDKVEKGIRDITDLP